VERGQRLEEAWFLGMRRNNGVSWNELADEFGDDAINEYRERVQRLATDGLVAADCGRVQLTDRGRMMSNEVFGQFIREGVATT
jgi:oxygen-independent coproporphyrinogen-3 oxidase